MKREFLQSFQVGDQPLPKAVMDAIMEENGRDIENAKKAFADYEGLKQNLEETKLQLSALQQEDIEGLKQAAQHYKQELDAQKKAHQAELSQLRFQGVLHSAIGAAGGRNEKAICALLDLEALQKEADPVQATQEALQQIKQESPYLFTEFQVPPAYARATGTAFQTPQPKPATLAGALREKFERK